MRLIQDCAALIQLLCVSRADFQHHGQQPDGEQPHHITSEGSSMRIIASCTLILSAESLGGHFILQRMLFWLEFDVECSHLSYRI